MSADELHVDSSSLARYESETENSIAIRTLDDIKRVSLIFVKSGMFKGDRGLDAETKMYQAGVKIIAGVEFGIQPFAAMRGINIINGNAEMSANLMAAKVKKHPKYDYRVTSLTNDGCELTFFEYLSNGTKEELGPSVFTMKDAERAGLMSNPTWRKFPQNMCFARALSNGVRIHCPDVFYGAPVYTDGEISGEFETSTEQPAVAAEPVSLPAASDTVEGEVVVVQDAPDTGTEDQPVAEVQEGDDEPLVDDASAAAIQWISKNQQKAIMALADDLKIPSKDERLSVVADAIERTVKSTNELNFAEAQKVIAHMQDMKKRGGAS